MNKGKDTKQDSGKIAPICTVELFVLYKTLERCKDPKLVANIKGTLAVNLTGTQYTKANTLDLIDESNILNYLKDVYPVGTMSTDLFEIFQEVMSSSNTSSRSQRYKKGTLKDQIISAGVSISKIEKCYSTKVTMISLNHVSSIYELIMSDSYKQYKQILDKIHMLPYLDSLCKKDKIDSIILDPLFSFRPKIERHFVTVCEKVYDGKTILFGECSLGLDAKSQTCRELYGLEGYTPRSIPYFSNTLGIPTEESPFTLRIPVSLQKDIGTLPSNLIHIFMDGSELAAEFLDSAQKKWVRVNKKGIVLINKISLGIASRLDEYTSNHIEELYIVGALEVMKLEYATLEVYSRATSSKERVITVCPYSENII